MKQTDNSGALARRRTRPGRPPCFAFSPFRQQNRAQLVLPVPAGGAAFRVQLLAIQQWWITCAQRIATGFGFLHQSAQFAIGEKLIDYTPRDSYTRALAVGLLNTLSPCGIVLATVLGFVVGIGRVSKNWLLMRKCVGYVELLRNVPVILQVIFWAVVIRNLPSPREAIILPGMGFLTNRGLTFYRPGGTAAGYGP